MTLRVWWAWDYEVRDLGSFPTKSTYAGHNNPVPVVRLADLREVVTKARAALDRIAHDPDDMEIRRTAEVECFYAMQQLLAQLKGVGDE